MTNRNSSIEMDKLAVMQKSFSNGNRGRSLSPSKPGNNSRSSSLSRDDFNKDVKWSITNHDPSERIVKMDGNGQKAEEDGVTWEDEVSEEEHISDDDNNEKFQYNETSNILPNYACHDEKINEISKILEHSNLNDKSTVQRLEDLTASERAFANAKTIGSKVDDNVLSRLSTDKQKLTGDEGLDLKRMEQDASTRKQKLENYSDYRKKIIHQERDPYIQSDSAYVGASTGPGAKSPPLESPSEEKGDFLVPYTSEVEDKLDSVFASQLNETIKEGEIDSNKAQSRIIQTITRGKFFQLIDTKVKPKMFLLCIDFSPESIFALEWALGTVLVDGSVLFVICVIEENDTNHNLKGNTLNESARESQRLEMLNKAKQQVLNLLKLTKLQIHIVIEIIHHPIPRHLILEFTDNLQPTLVIVGSKGQSALKGVLLGSLSNYLITKSSVPVMVVREKLKKINRFKSGSSFFANNIKPLTLSEARID